MPALVVDPARACSSASPQGDAFSVVNYSAKPGKLALPRLADAVIDLGGLFST